MCMVIIELWSIYIVSRSPELADLSFFTYFSSTVHQLPRSYKCNDNP